MKDQPQPGPEYSGDAITCTINNQTPGNLQYNKSSITGGHLSIATNTLAPGSSEEAFSAQGPSGLPSGCGGQVVYNLPNGQDQLVVVYNVSVTGQSAEVFTELQNQNGERPGCNDYFVVVSHGSVSGKSLKPVVTVYEAGAYASPVTGYVPDNGNMQVTVVNELATWITLNKFPDPAWDVAQMFSNATSSIAPGQSAVVLGYGSAYKFTLIYNITEDYLLTITLDRGNPPTTGFNTSCPYTATVTGGLVDRALEEYAYTVTVSPLPQAV
ncbi:MAG TPA: hypothetical protein VLE27_16530 [Thermoanaerobaculia bacterium]|nr:hypothetical protein [Thermoanaerobaculia bacterium]